MSRDPDTLRTYARILDMPKREHKGGPLYPATEVNKAAAEALRFMATAMEMIRADLRSQAASGGADG